MFRGHAFRWTEAAGLQDLGTFGGRFSTATAVSADGSVIAGDIDGRVFVWSEAGGIQNLGTPGHASGVSADGSVVVGTYSNGLPDSAVRLADQPLHGFRWTRSNGLTDIGTFDGVPLRPAAVSADGSIVVGDYGAGLGYATSGVFVASYREDGRL